MSLASGFKFGQYEIVSMLGAGGMGEVYRARDTRLQREVAIKILPAGFDEQPERVTRFTREAQVLASLNHPAIASIYGFEEGPAALGGARAGEAGHHVRGLVMELVEGPTLADRLVAGPMPIDEILSVGKQIVDGVEAAHEQGIIHAVTIARDGRTIVFAASTDGITRLYVRRRDDVELRAIAGSEGASSPVFSPDGRWLAFVSGTELKKTTLDGPPVTLGKVADHRGIAWLDNQTIVFAPFAAGGLSRISASGGEPQRLTRLDSSKGERTHRWPTVLPGGAAVLFTIGSYGSPDSYENSRIDAVIVASGERRTVFEGASIVRYVPGRLVFSRGGLLYDVAFDATSLTVSGTPTTIARGVGGDETTGAVHFAVSDDGTLVYVPDDSGGGVRRRLTWVGPTGAAEPLSLPPNAYNDLRISPDDSRVAVVVGASGSGDIWIHDFRRATFTRLTFDNVNASPIWSKDGQYVYFAAIDSSGLKTTIKRRRADGGRDAETLGAVDSRLYLRELTSDEKAIFADDFTKEGDVRGKRAEVALVSLNPPVTERIIVSTPGDDFESSLAPNGRWLAYSSDESGRAEIYVRDLANEGHKSRGGRPTRERCITGSRTACWRPRSPGPRYSLSTRRGRCSPASTTYSRPPT